MALEIVKTSALKDMINQSVARVREKLNALNKKGEGGEDAGIDIGLMFELQLEANLMNQLTDAASNFVGATHSANMGVARNVKT